MGPIRVLAVTDHSIKIRRPQIWNHREPETVCVKWNPASASGKLKAAIANAGLGSYVDWYGSLFNDAQGFRKSDKTVARRLAWKSVTIKPLGKRQKSRFASELHKQFGKSLVQFDWRCSKDWKGDVLVWLRENACDC